jgi:hypothetical protein
LQKGNTKITPSVAARQGELAVEQNFVLVFLMFFFEELFFSFALFCFFFGAEYKINGGKSIE